MSEPSKCPHCGARGVKIADEISRDGVSFRFDYCGVCGKNYPRNEADAPRRSGNVLQMPETSR